MLFKWDIYAVRFVPFVGTIGVPITEKGVLLMNTALNITLGIILLLAAIFLIVAVLMQSGKSHKLSGTIAGGAETFFGKTKGKSIDKLFSKLTTIVSVVFVVLVIVVYIFQDKPIEDAKNDALDDALTDTEITEEADK